MTTPPKWLQPAAARSAQETWTLGHALEQYRTKHGLTQDALAQELGIALETLHELYLCRRPQSAEQLAAVVARFPAKADKLEAILQQVPN